MKLGTWATVAALATAMTLGAASQAEAGSKKTKYYGSCDAWLRAANDAARRGDKYGQKVGMKHYADCKHQERLAVNKEIVIKNWKGSLAGSALGRPKSQSGFGYPAAPQGADLILQLGIIGTQLGTKVRSGKSGGGHHR